MLNKIVPIRPFDSFAPLGALAPRSGVTNPTTFDQSLLSQEQKAKARKAKGPKVYKSLTNAQNYAGHSTHLHYSTPKKSHCPIKVNATKISGFKKQLSNQITARGYLLYPSFNRRKHSHSHWSIIGHQLRKLGKTFGYLSVNKINFLIASALKESYGQRNPSAIDAKRAIPNLVNTIESDSSVLLVRNQVYFSFAQAKQSINHAWYKPRLVQITQIANRSNANFRKSASVSFRSVKHLTVNQPSWVQAGGVLRNL